MKTLIATAMTAAALLSAPLAANALVYQFNAGLNGANEVPPTPSPATGVATLFYDDMNTALTSDDSYSFALSAFNLSGPATGAHIHAPAPVGSNAAIVVHLDEAPFTFFTSGGTTLIGGAGVAPPYATFLSQLRAGLGYVNIHTALFPGGEIRGQLVEVAAVPEPATVALLFAGLGVVGFAARRKARTSIR